MSRDDLSLRLREAIGAFAADRAPELVEQAQAEALVKVRRALAETMTESLLAESQRVLGGDRPSTPAPERRSPPEEPARSGTGVALARYVYGVVSPRLQMPPGLAGVDPDHEVSLLEEEGLAALISHVSLAEFGEEPLRDNLNDVGWLEEKARAHEHVLDVALQRGTVVPLRLCTIYSGEEQVREMLVRERDVMLDALDRLDGRAEWGVKAFAEPQALERAAARRAGDGPGREGASRGTAYMDRRRHEAQARVEVEEIAEEWASAIHHPLAGAASEALLNPLQSSEVSGREGDMLLNGVYLVEDGSVAGFSGLVDGLAQEHRAHGVSVELTGPWPPYNFVKSSIESAR